MRAAVGDNDVEPWRVTKRRILVKNWYHINSCHGYDIFFDLDSFCTSVGEEALWWVEE